MKVTAIIAEYNPLHYGHIKQIEYVKNVIKADKIIVVMSGNFTQRGEPAILNKFTRAKHAIKAGANMVIELPTIFSCANAEIFAKGAIKIISSLNIVNSICFGIESGEKQEYIELAKEMNNESKDFKKLLKEKLENGISLAKAKFEVVKELKQKEFKEELISSPNNILGLEYTKAILSSGSNIEIEPLLRENTHNNSIIKKGITSALSIRTNIKNGKIKKTKKSLPKFVYNDIVPTSTEFDDMIFSSILTESADNMKEILDCTEGLENRIKALAKDNLSLNSLIEKVSTKRYTEGRIRRILIANLLKIKKQFITDAIENDLYAKILAMDNDKELLSKLSLVTNTTLITRKSDALKLKSIAEKCFEIDTLANDLYNLIRKEKNNQYNMIIM